MSKPMFLQVARIAKRTRVLGPGVRAVVWVQGCPFRCQDCVAQEALPFIGGRAMEVSEVAEFLMSQRGIDGVTFSGGEPMSQAEALAELCDSLRAERDWSLMSYTGYTLEWIRERGSHAQARFLAQLDILIDGLYRREAHADLLWRGSTNQRVHLLTARHGSAIAVEDRSAGVEIQIDSEGRVEWTGVPPVRGFRRTFEAALKKGGIQISPERETQS